MKLIHHVNEVLIFLCIGRKSVCIYFTRNDPTIFYYFRQENNFFVDLQMKNAGKQSKHKQQIISLFIFYGLCLFYPYTVRNFSTAAFGREFHGKIHKISIKCQLL